MAAFTQEERRQKAKWKQKLNKTLKNKEKDVALGYPYMGSESITPILSRGSDGSPTANTPVVKQAVFTPEGLLTPTTPKKSVGSFIGFRKYAKFSGSRSAGSQTPRSKVNMYNAFVEGNFLEDSASISPLHKYGDAHEASKALQSIVTPTRNRGPKIKPFVFAQTQHGTPRKPLVGTICVICTDHLDTKLFTEKIIELKCGDYVHGECFRILVDHEIDKFVKSNPSSPFRDSALLNASHMFPQCTGQKCKQQGRTMVPVDKSYVDEIISSALLTQRDHFSKTNRSNLVALQTTLKNQNVNSESKPRRLRDAESDIRGQLQLTNNGSLLNQMSPVPFNWEALGVARPKTNSVVLKNRHSIVSSPSPAPSISTINTATIKMDGYSTIPLDTLKDHFIKYLIDYCSHFSLTLLLRMGPLRLVDKLLYSVGAEFNSRICYLFTNYLILWLPNNSEPLVFPLLNGLLKNFASKPTTIELLTSDANSPVSRIWLKSDIDSITEKWVVAIADLNATFPSNVVTSTITLPQLSRGSLESVDLFSPHNSSINIRSVTPLKPNCKSFAGMSDIPISPCDNTIGPSEPSPHLIAVESESSTDSDSDVSNINKILTLRKFPRRQNSTSSETIYDKGIKNDQQDGCLGLKHDLAAKFESVKEHAKNVNSYELKLHNMNDGWKDLFSDINDAISNRYKY